MTSNRSLYLSLHSSVHSPCIICSPPLSPPLHYSPLASSLPFHLLSYSLHSPVHSRPPLHSPRLLIWSPLLPPSSPLLSTRVLSPIPSPLLFSTPQFTPVRLSTRLASSSALLSYPLLSTSLHSRPFSHSISSPILSTPPSTPVHLFTRLASSSALLSYPLLSTTLHSRPLSHSISSPILSTPQSTPVRLSTRLASSSALLSLPLPLHYSRLASSLPFHLLSYSLHSSVHSRPPLHSPRLLSPLSTPPHPQTGPVMPGGRITYPAGGAKPVTSCHPARNHLESWPVSWTWRPQWSAAVHGTPGCGKGSGVAAGLGK